VFWTYQYECNITDCIETFLYGVGTNFLYYSELQSHNITLDTYDKRDFKYNTKIHTSTLAPDQ
jgi:hypothetical protein